MTITDIPSVLNVNMASPSTPNWIFGGFVYEAGEHQITNELKISNDPGSALQWLAGLYLYQIKASTLITFAGFQMPDFTQQNVAPYAQLTYAFNDKFRAVVGARYSWVKKDGSFLQPNVLPDTSATWSSVDWKAGLEYDVLPIDPALRHRADRLEPGNPGPGGHCRWRSFQCHQADQAGFR